MGNEGKEKWTEGTWFVIDHPDGWTIQDRPNGTGRCIARFYEDSSREIANLIAAAPALVKAVEAAELLYQLETEAISKEEFATKVRAIGFTGDTFEAVLAWIRDVRRSALAQAKGEC